MAGAHQESSSWQSTPTRGNYNSNGLMRSAALPEYPQDPAAWLNSVLIHGLVVTALTIPFVASSLQRVIARGKPNITELYFPMHFDLPQGASKPHGGGGGGENMPTPASKGAIPKFSWEQIAPPAVVVPRASQLAVTPAIIGPPKLKLPEMRFNMSWGDPHGALAALSGGPGSDGGIGSGDDDGVGPDRGPGYGSGGPGGYGGGEPVFEVGGGVSAPRQVFSPAPDYSEEARKAKFQGVVTLLMVVDAHGNPTAIRVAKPLGMGLDEKAVEKVRTWKFLPGMKNGVPVAVRMVLEVSFRLF